MSDQPEPSDCEDDFSLTKMYLDSTIIFSVVLFALSGFILLLDGSDVPSRICLIAGCVGVLIGLAGLKWINRIEADPTFPNPRNNRVNRGLMKLEKDHPIVAGFLSIVLFVLIVRELLTR